MSVAATEWAWAHSESSGNTLLVLLAIADAADQHGENAWPAQQTIANRARVSVRTVRRLVADLVELGELHVEEFAGGTAKMRADRRPHLYSLPKMGGQHGRTAVSPRTPTGGQEGTDGRTNDDPRADTAVPRTSFSERPQEQEIPSGGNDAAAPSAPEADPSPEEDMSRAAALDQPGLFDAPVVEKPKQPRKAPKLPEGAAAVVAAFVESYSKSHGGARPLRSDIGKVAAAAKLMLSNGEATEEQLVLCGQKMGLGPYANLYQEFKFLRPSTHGAVPRSLPHDDPAWDTVRTSIEFTPDELAEPMEAWL